MGDSDARIGTEYIKFDDVSYMYNKASEKAISGINTTFKCGEFAVVIGPNGSGKSTLARHMNALLVPCRGVVTVDGIDTRNLDSVRDIRRRVGFVFQDPDNQLVGSTVEEDAAFGPENLGEDSASIRESVNLSLELVGLSGLNKCPVHSLSGGQKQQLAIAGALAMKTQCLVLDEPTSMIGPVGKRIIIRLLKSIQKELSMTVILVTHFMEEAVFADRVLVMEKGQIVMDGSPINVFKCHHLLAKIGLELPDPAELSRRLRLNGVDLPENVLTVDELVACLCQL